MHTTPRGPQGDWTWCAGCERVHATDAWQANGWFCPTVGCAGSIMMASDTASPTDPPRPAYMAAGLGHVLDKPVAGGWYPSTVPRDPALRAIIGSVGAIPKSASGESPGRRLRENGKG